MHLKVLFFFSFLEFQVVELNAGSICQQSYGKVQPTTQNPWQTIQLKPILATSNVSKNLNVSDATEPYMKGFGEL